MRNVLCNPIGPFCVSRTTSSTLTGAAIRGANWWSLPPIRDFMKLKQKFSTFNDSKKSSLPIWSVTHEKYWDFLV